ncbi:TIGR01777 family oxidoreductase [Myxococcota bacterium]|nr:TIGR01777 family oxidoreductase [Myxococcota bacterium]
MVDRTESRVVIAGGSGFLGLNLARALADAGREVVILSRHAPKAVGPWRHVAWDARSLGDWTRELDGASALVNLVGRTVDCIKTPDHQDEILRSRVESTRVLGRALEGLARPIPVWVQMSTAHIYGDPPEVVCDEESAFGTGLAPFVARAWEEAFEAARPASTRGVVLRTSFVMGRSGGALSRLVGIARVGLGGRVGHGRQGISWIHERDMNRILVRAIEDDRMSGAYLATAPNPVSNAEFMRALRRALRIPFGFPAAAWQVRLAAPLLQTDPELALYGRRCVSTRLRALGFEFEFSEVEAALAALFPR